jgi:hypothetical protein
MTYAQVEQAKETLAARGEPISVRNINRLLRQTPPRFRGASFSDLLRLLKIQRVPSKTELAIDSLDAMTQACADAIAGPHSPSRLQRLLAMTEDCWVQNLAVLLDASARAEDVTALDEAFDRLRRARSAVITAQSRR